MKKALAAVVLVAVFALSVSAEGGETGGPPAPQPQSTTVTVIVTILNAILK